MAVSSAVTSGEEGTGRGGPLLWYDYLEVVLLVVACVLGLLGNLAVFKVSLRIRSFSRQISLLFCGILCADVLICATRIPATVYLIFSQPYRGGDTMAVRLEDTNTVASTGTFVSSPMTLTGDLGGGGRSSARSQAAVDDGVSGWGRTTGLPGVKAEEREYGANAGNTTDMDVACEVCVGLVLSFSLSLPPSLSLPLLFYPPLLPPPSQARYESTNNLCSEVHDTSRHLCYVHSVISDLYNCIPHLRGGDVTVYVLDINQSSLPTLFILFLCLFLSSWPSHLYFIP